MADWTRLDFQQDPRLLFGHRAGPRRLDGRRLDVHEDAFDDLRSVCESTLAELRQAVGRPYEPFAGLERGEEYFEVEVGVLPQRRSESRTGTQTSREVDATRPSDEDSNADLVRLVRSVDQLERLQRLDDLKWIFYAICWPTPEGVFAFVKKSNPRRALQTGRRWFQFGDALRIAPAPDLVLEPDVDLVVTPTEIAVRNPVAFKDLLNDIQVQLAEVPADVRALQARLKGSIPLSSSAADALEQAAGRRVSYARRVVALSDRVAAIDLTVASFKRECRRVGVTPGLLVGPNNQFNFT